MRRSRRRRPRSNGRETADGRWLDALRTGRVPACLVPAQQVSRRESISSPMLGCGDAENVQRVARAAPADALGGNRYHQRMKKGVVGPPAHASSDARGVISRAEIRRAGCDAGTWTPAIQRGERSGRSRARPPS